METLTSPITRPEMPEIEFSTQRESLPARFKKGIRAAAAVLGLTVAATGILATAEEADATPQNVPHQVEYTDGDPLYLHPDSPTISSTTNALMPAGAQFDVDCWTYGDTVIDNPVWLYGTYVAENKTGYAADEYVNTEWRTTDDFAAQGIRNCADPEVSTSPTIDPAETLESITYNRDATVAWARTHAQDTPSYPASCTQFVSQALWAGGMPRTSEWTDQGGYGVTLPGSLDRHRPGTVATWAVPEFKDYIQSEYPYSQLISLDLGQNYVSQADLGDVILYDWENDGELDHASLITDIAPGHYPEVSEWSALEGTAPTPYIDRGWTWSELSGGYLQNPDLYPNAVAFLLDIDTTIIGDY